MYKSLVLVCVIYCAVIEARPKWQFLPARPGYVPVYIQSGDTPLEEINPDLAEAFHALPSGRSASKQIDASPEVPEQNEQNDENDENEPSVKTEEAKPVEVVDDIIDHRPYEKKVLEKKKKATEIA